MPAKPVKIAVTGAGGQIGYALIFRIASGGLFGPDQPVALGLLEITPALPSLGGTLMELDDCAFPLLAKVTATDKAEEAFADADWVILVGGLPRKDGMTRADLRGKPRFAEIADDLLAFLQGDPLVAHNAPFDFGFLARSSPARARPSTPPRGRTSAC